MRRAWLSLFVGCSLASAGTPERPVALILSDTDGTVTEHSSALPRLNKPGRAVYSGETLRSGDKSVVFAHCLAASAKGAVYSLAPNSSISLPNAGLPDQPPLTPIADLSICRLPEIDPTPIATTLDDPSSRQADTASLEVRISALSPGRQDALRRKLQLIESLQQSPNGPLIAYVSRAEVFREAGLLKDALDAYRELRNHWPDATWTRSVITELTRDLTTQPEVLPNVVATRGITVQGPASQTFDPSQGRTYALLIGISDYQKVPSLCFAARDAESFKEYLQSPRGGGLPEAQITILTNRQATRDGIDKAIADFVRGKGQRNNTLIVFVAGHGRFLCTDKEDDHGKKQACDAASQKPFILTYDSDPADGKTTGLPMAEFRDMITARTAEFGRVLAFVDVCHAGHIGDLPQSTRLHAAEVSNALEADTGMLGILMANSAAKTLEDELALEMTKYGHGVFTYYLLEGLNKGVTPLQGKIYLAQLHAYVLNQVQEATNLQESPSLISPDRKLVAVDDASVPGISVDEPLPKTCDVAESRRGETASISEATRAFNEVLKKGLITPGEPGSAFDLLRNNSAITDPVELQNQRDRLRVALEEAGQTVILNYLKGDQVPQLQPDFERGARYFEAALSLAPDSAFDESRYLFCKGRAAIFAKQYAAAETMLDRSVGIDPTRSYSLNAMGIAFLEQIPGNAANFPRAVAAFEQAIRFAPYWAYPRHNLALALAEEGQFERAILQYQQAWLLAPTYSYLPYNLGLLYQQIHEIDNAKQSYQAALRLSKQACQGKFPCPSEARANVALGLLNEQDGKRKAAEKLYRLALQSDPSQIEGRQDLASLCARTRRPVEAEQLWRQNLANNPDYVPTLISYAEFLRGQGRVGEAIPLLRRLVQARPQYVPGLIDLAESLTKTNQPALAVPLLESARNMASANPTLWLAIARNHLAAGHLQQATEAYDRALSLETDRAQRKAINLELRHLNER